MKPDKRSQKRGSDGRFLRGGPGGPGRPRKEVIPGDVVAELARPLTPGELHAVTADYLACRAHRDLATSFEHLTDQLELFVRTRGLAAVVLHGRLEAEALALVAARKDREAARNSEEGCSGAAI